MTPARRRRPVVDHIFDVGHSSRERVVVFLNQQLKLMPVHPAVLLVHLLEGQVDARREPDAQLGCWVSADVERRRHTEHDAGIRSAMRFMGADGQEKKKKGGNTSEKAPCGHLSHQLQAGRGVDGEVQKMYNIGCATDALKRLVSKQPVRPNKQRFEPLRVTPL